MNGLSIYQKGFLAAFLAGVLWSTGGVFIKLISLDAFQISALRSFFAAATILFIFRSKAVMINKGVVINGLFYSGILILFVMATKLTTAANAIFLQYTAPIYVLILEPLILKTRFERINGITIVICFIGMTLFFVGEISPGHMLGNILALTSGLAFAGFLIGMRKNDHKYQYATIFYGNVFITLICFFSLPAITNFLVSDILMIAFLGIFQIGIAYAIFTYALKRVHAIEASLITMIEPVLNPIWVFIGYGEYPSPYAMLGGLIILLMIAARALILDKYISKKFPFKEQV
ncbi:MAG: EamA family transporter [Chlorobiaceae bacterium]|nr:EamA family transporter [Chlorobiaceae bacterium]MBA4310703.1 EamA family transporter [Chlorobiaceae bacterium]